ncbi:MAG: hypothetical protein IT334_02585 [Thermomicrobiales bacterium]|nr:hypothetical protein [Thermomicrobiales bacterium]
MSQSATVQAFLAGSGVDDAVFELRPDYRVLLIAATGLIPGPSDTGSDALLTAAESAAGKLLHGQAPEELPNIGAWRDAYRAFGSKPQRTRNSLEALLRRVNDGLPRINRLTDIYNAVSVKHLLPLGGEDLARYVGPARLIRSAGTEPFDTVSGGEVVIEHPDVGEVVWCDDAGVTCRRWNWRQCRRTQLTDETTSAIFILDALDPMSTDELQAAADELTTHLRSLGPDVVLAQRLIAR